MDINKFFARFPNIHTVLTVLVSGVCGGVLAIGTFLMFVPIDSSSPVNPPHDPRFVALGRLYHYQLGKAYATAWEDGATLLDSGKTLASALESVGHSWETNRGRLFDQLLTPEFSKLIPESAKDSDISSHARAAMSSAWRSFAIGLRE